MDDNPRVRKWLDKLNKNSEKTSALYVSNLWIYWNESLSKKYDSLEAWVSAIKEQSKSDEYDVQKQWAVDLEEWILTRISPRTGRPLAVETRNVYFWAIRSYLEDRVGEKGLTDYTPILATKKDILREKEFQRDTETATPDEIRKIVLEANTRDRAVLLTSVWGLGVGEFIEFSKSWYKYIDAIRANKSPIKIFLTRGKTSIDFYTFVYEDAVEALHTLLEERERTLRRPLTKEDHLFVEASGEPFKSSGIQRQVRLLAERTGVEKLHGEKEKWTAYRVRPHELGRDLFKTLGVNKQIPRPILDFLMGHRVDPLKYDKSPWTEEGEKQIRQILQKLTPYLNLVTRRGPPPEAEAWVQRIDGLAIAKGYNLDDFKQMVISYASGLPDIRARLAEVKSEGTREEALEFVLSHMSYSEFRPILVGLSQKLNEESKPHVKQEVIEENDLQKYLDNGWHFVSTFNNHHAIVEIDEKKLKGA